MTGPELPQFAAMSERVAKSAAEGDYAGAARQAAELLALCRTALGERDPNILELRVSLATLRLQAGEGDVAYAEFERLIPELREVLGGDHVSTLAARHLLADRPRQDATSSLAEWLQLFADEQRTLGADHRSTLAARERVAEKRWDIGDLVGAMAEGEMVLAARRRAHGDDHPDTLGTRLMLAIWRGRAGAVRGAVAEIGPLLGELREKLGRDHLQTLMARHALTLWAPDGHGLDAWEALVAEEARLLGDEHPVTAAARHELARRRARHT